MEKVLAVCAVYWITLSLITNTHGIWNTIICKVIPFFTGLATLLCAMDMIGWVNIF